MEFKRIIVLANSYKKQGRCLAGRTLDARNTVGDWVRPISAQAEGELFPRHMRTANGSPLRILDIVDVPLDHPAGNEYHPEDWVVDASGSWDQRQKFARENLANLEEKPSDLWVESTSRTDRVTGTFLLKSPRHQSLYLVRPTGFHVELTNNFNHFEGRNQQKRRACFTYRNQNYSLGVTDPEFIDLYAKKFPAPDKPAIVVRPPFGDNCLLCVSLTPEFNGYHYKVVATVLELP
jgi:hypothetical protein